MIVSSCGPTRTSTTHPTNALQGFFCVQCQSIRPTQNSLKPDVTGSYTLADFLHMMHGQGVSEIFGVTQYDIDDKGVTDCHALRARIARTLELEFVADANRSEWDRQMHVDAAKAYSHPSFEEYYKRTGGPLYVYDDRGPDSHPHPSCKCVGCLHATSANYPYAELTKSVSLAIKKGSRVQARDYFLHMMATCAGQLPQPPLKHHDPDGMFAHWYHTCWTPLSIEVDRSKNIKFVATAFHDSANDYVLNWIGKTFGTKPRLNIEYNVMKRCVEGFFWEIAST